MHVPVPPGRVHPARVWRNAEHHVASGVWLLRDGLQPCGQRVDVSRGHGDAVAGLVRGRDAERDDRRSVPGRVVIAAPLQLRPPVLALGQLDEAGALEPVGEVGHGVEYGGTAVDELHERLGVVGRTDVPRRPVAPDCLASGRQNVAQRGQVQRLVAGGDHAAVGVQTRAGAEQVPDGGLEGFAFLGGGGGGGGPQIRVAGGVHGDVDVDVDV